MRRLFALAPLFALLACSSPAGRPHIRIRAAVHEAAIAELMVLVPYAELSVGGDGAADILIDVVDGIDDCDECYRLDPIEGGVQVTSGGLLGAQYGVAHALELLGFRFYHPWHTRAPDEPAVPASDAAFGAMQAPQMRTRGLHLHTIHPTEAYYAFWEPGDANLAEARRVIAWIVVNRGNYVQWVAMDNITSSAADQAAWKPHTQAIVDHARAHGLRVGLAIQLFGASNLQQGFDLVDSEDGATREEIEGRYPAILDGITWDNINLSFGEFFGEGPEPFIAAVDLAHAILQEQAPATEMATTVHVGADQRIEYMGEDLIYYFLVKFANEAIIPWIHSVMFYNLYEDAGGAYHHDAFDEHRAYLLDRLRAGGRVGYFPETAYWVAFDNSVPAYVPLYVRSRWLDLARLREDADAEGIDRLQEHVLFSSGWEWGFWQNDYASLRMSWQLPAAWEDLFRAMLDAELAEPAIELAKLQHEYLLEGRLAAYLAGRDVYMDVGRDLDIVSQPDRPALDEVAALDEAGRTAFEADVLTPLAAFAAAVGALRTEVDGLDRNDRWYRELADGVAVVHVRLQYIRAIYMAAFEWGASGDPGQWPGLADELLAEGRAIVERRHADLHSPTPENLIYVTTNATLYQFGYLKQAHELCYWERERAQMRRLTLGDDLSVPGCIF